MAPHILIPMLTVQGRSEQMLDEMEQLKARLDTVLADKKKWQTAHQVCLCDVPNVCMYVLCMCVCVCVCVCVASD